MLSSSSYCRVWPKFPISTHGASQHWGGGGGGSHSGCLQSFTGTRRTPRARHYFLLSPPSVGFQPDGTTASSELRRCVTWARRQERLLRRIGALGLNDVGSLSLVSEPLTGRSDTKLTSLNPKINTGLLLGFTKMLPFTTRSGFSIQQDCKEGVIAQI